MTSENGSDKRRFVIVRNPQEVKRDRAVRAREIERLEAEIEALK